ncbi:hypothetical protein HBB16_19250 [Pseudonocardia sp. MCCB 268]|nr:hypothetical protein [Pseudonocardia cytotoxica]
MAPYLTRETQPRRAGRTRRAPTGLPPVTCCWPPASCAPAGSARSWSAWRRRCPAGRPVRRVLRPDLITVRTVGAGDPPWPGSSGRGREGPTPSGRRRRLRYAAACRPPGSATPGLADIRIDDVELAPTPDTTPPSGDAA